MTKSANPRPSQSNGRPDLALSRSRLAKIVAGAHELADVAGAVIRPYFRKVLAVTNKADGGAFDPVTAADRAAERAISKRLAVLFPDHGLIGEEYGETNPDARFQWIVDPIDGTRSFIMGLPTWGTLIGLLDRGEPVFGMMDQPFTGERYFATGKSAHLRHAGRDRRLRTRACAGLDGAIFSSTHPELFGSPREKRILSRLTAEVRMARYGGDCYAYCQLAAGHVDLIVEPGLQAYDIAPLIPVIEAAGGRVTTWDGGPAARGGNIVAAGDLALHAAALAIIQAA